MPSKTITVTNGDGSTRTITIPDRSRFAGIKTFSRNGKLDDETTQIQVTVAGHSDLDGVYTTYNGLATGGSDQWRQEGGNGQINAIVNEENNDTTWFVLDSNDFDPEDYDMDTTWIAEGVVDRPWKSLTNYTPSVTITAVSDTITVNRTAPVITSDRKGASRPLLSKVVGGAAAAYSLRDLNDKVGNNKVVRVRKGYAQERDFSAKEVSNGTLEEWVKTFPVNAQNISNFNLSGIIHAGSTSNSIMNGFYVQDGTSGGKKQWLKAHQYGDSTIRWINSTGLWEISLSGTTQFTSNEDTTYPWSVTTWTSVGNRTGTPTFSSDGFVSTWYDQSGNSNHAIQPTAWRQPRIFVGGSLVKDSRNNPAVNFSNDALTFTSDLVASEPYSCIAYHELDFSTMILRGDGNSPRFRAASNGYQINDKTFPVASTQGLVSVIKDSSNCARVYSDGTQSSSGQKGVGSSSLPFKNLCTNYGFGGGNGKLSALIYYASDQSSNRLAIEANINNQYDIY